MKFREELPTLALLFVTYSAFALLTIFSLPLWLAIPALATIIALHSSLQHEVLHGHPFPQAWLSDLTVFPAIGLFVPYQRFKDTHLTHHFDPNLTDPYDDPETNFMDVEMWEKMPRPIKALAQFNNTLLGRILVGPAIGIAVFYAGDARQMMRGNKRIWRSYLEHALGVSFVLLWLTQFSAMPLWAYVIAAYFGMSLLKIRTFLEHRAHDKASARSVIIEDRGPLALIFLNNNYHAVHHAHPKVVWHKLPKLFRSKREHFLKRNGGYTYRSYAEIFGRYFLRAKDPVAHPLWSKSNRTSQKNLTLDQ